MAESITVGGIVIPITVVRLGDKAAITNIANQYKQLTSVIQQNNKVNKEANSGKRKSVQITQQYGEEIKRVEIESKKLNGVMTTTRNITKDKHGWATGIASIDAMIKGMNTLRWSFVNISFAVGTITALASPFIWATKNAMDFELQAAKIQSILNVSSGGDMGLADFTDSISNSTAALEMAGTVMDTTSMKLQSLQNQFEFKMAMKMDPGAVEREIESLQKYLNGFEENNEASARAGIGIASFAGMQGDAKVVTAEEVRAREVLPNITYAEMLEMIKDTGFSMDAIGEAYIEIVRTGVDKVKGKEILKNSLIGATGQQVDPKQLVSVVTSSMAAFKDQGLDSAHVVNTLAEVTSNFKTDLGKLAPALSYSSSIAAILGINFDELAASIGYMANSAIDGSKAGTAMRNMMKTLYDPTTEAKQAMSELGTRFYDAEGQLKKWPNVLANLRVSLEGLTDKQQMDQISNMFSLRGQTAAVVAIRRMVNEEGRIGAEILAEERKEVLANRAVYQQYADEIERYTGLVDATETAIKNHTANIKGMQAELKSLKSTLADVNDEIKTLSDPRFTGETDILKLITQVELNIKKQAFATYGLGTAQEFLADAIGMSVNELSDLGKQVDSITKKTETSQDSYEAWQETIREFIRGAIDVGNELGKNVSGAVGQYSTLLLSTSKFSDENDSQSESVSALKDAYDIYYGAMHDDVAQSIDDHQRQGNTVFSTSQGVIDALNKQWTEQARVTMSIDYTSRALESEQSQLDAAKESLIDYKSSLSEVNSELQNHIDLLAQIAQAESSSSSGGGGGGRPPGVQGPLLPDGSFYSSSSSSSGNLTGSSSSLSTGMSSGYTGYRFNDFIARPGMGIASISPDDTVVGVKDTSKLGGSSVSIANITVNGASGSPEDFARQFATELKRELSTI